jgi:hypothetical protein
MSSQMTRDWRLFSLYHERCPGGTAGWQDDHSVFGPSGMTPLLTLTERCVMSLPAPPVESPNTRPSPSQWERVDLTGGWQRVPVCVLHASGPCALCAPLAPAWASAFWRHHPSGSWHVFNEEWRCDHRAIVCPFECRPSHPDAEWLTKWVERHNTAPAGSATDTAVSDALKKGFFSAKDKAADVYGKARTRFTQEEAFAAFNEAMDEMTKVVSVQHARLSELERTVAELTGRVARLDAVAPAVALT